LSGATSRPPAVMIQGAGSNVGKSLIVAGLCRLFADQGLAVRPFKPQNMSNNAAATADGGEIGRAQALQALAARVTPSVHMNPVLLKPETDTGAQVIVQGRRHATWAARDFAAKRRELLPAVLNSFDRTSGEADLTLIEGAGSPAETNLRDGDIANMGFAEAADVPVIIVGDIERGGVIASLVGTHAVLEETDRTRIKAFLINKFRGDPSLFDEGVKTIEERTGWEGLGVVPYFAGARALPAEDVLDIGSSVSDEVGAEGTIKIVVPLISRIANFDDLDPLKMEPGVSIEFAEPGKPLPRDVDLILLPGSKSTVADLEGLRAEGWDRDIAAHVRHGGHVLGICGGFQMLGRTIRDESGIEGRPGVHQGLGLLDIDTTLTGDKTVRPVRGSDVAGGHAVEGYEIHLGQSTGGDMSRPLFTIEGRPDGAASASGRVMGTYVHGAFQADPFRRAFLRRIGANADGDVNYIATVESALDELAAHLKTHLDAGRILEIAQAR